MIEDAGERTQAALPRWAKQGISLAAQPSRGNQPGPQLSDSDSALLNSRPTRSRLVFFKPLTVANSYSSIQELIHMLVDTS